MLTVYLTAGSVRLYAPTPSDDLSPLDERGDWQHIEAVPSRGESGLSFPTACAPSAPELRFPEQGEEWPSQPSG